MSDVSLVVNGRQMSGWTRISISLGVERCTASFELGMTEITEADDEVVTQPGDSCQVKIGSNVVITGFVDRVVPAISKTGHEISVVGRGKCADLVDCSNEWPGCQIQNGDAYAIATSLAKTYGIKVAIDPNAPRRRVPYLQFSRMESPWQIIEAACRWSALLAYELADGSLYLSQVGQRKHASGIGQGQNVERASFVQGLDQRFSIYEAFLLGVDNYGDAGSGGNLLATLKDSGVKRHRMKAIVIEGAAAADANLIAQRLLWESNRRIGRSQAVQVRVDSWFDSAGKLWQPNWLVPINLPTLKVQQSELVIGQVTYKVDDEGTGADLLLMPPGAFAVQPPVIPAQADVPASPNKGAR